MKPNNRTVGFVSLGCAKNQVDTELMIGRMTEAGFTAVQDAAQAAVLVVNTCAFIESAREEAVQTILEMAEYKKPENGCCRALLVAGCLVEKYEEDICREIPEVDGVIGVRNYADIAAVAEACLARCPGTPTGGPGALAGGPGAPADPAGHADLAGSTLPIHATDGKPDLSYMNGTRILSTPNGSAYLRISEGCDNRCSYCAIPSLRGPFRSRPMEELLGEAERIAQSGVRELNVIAQDTSRYGRDLYGEPQLGRLLRALDRIPGLEWIRVLYLYPDEITEELIEDMKACRKLVHYVDLPLQHISASVLKRMNRRGSPERIRRVLHMLREAFPDCVIRTTFIVGFPGETEADFRELCDFVREEQFERIGVFCYSPEEGTAAYTMPDPVPEACKEARRGTLMELAAEISHAKNRAREGTTVRVLTESVSDDGIFYVGRSYAEAPDADGKVYFTSAAPLEIGDMTDVHILIGEEYDVTGAAAD